MKLIDVFEFKGRGTIATIDSDDLDEKLKVGDRIEATNPTGTVAHGYVIGYEHVRPLDPTAHRHLGILIKFDAKVEAGATARRI